MIARHCVRVMFMLVVSALILKTGYSAFLR